MKSKIFLFVDLLAVLLLFSCNSRVQSNIDSIPIEKILPTPLSGKTSVFGRVILDETNQPIGGIGVWLAKVLRQEDEAFYFLDTVNSPSILTDENGEFLIQNVMPGEYVIVIGNPEMMYEIIAEDTGRAKVWQFRAEMLENVGDLNVRNLR